MRTLLALTAMVSLTGTAQAATLFTASSDQSGGLVKAYSTPTLAVTQTLLPFGPDISGANIAAASNSDGSATLVIGAGVGGQLVKALNAGTGDLLLNFLPFDPSYRGGVRVAAGDVTGDGVADIAVGAQSGSSAVKVFDGSSGTEIRSFSAFAPGFTGGVSLALGDVTGDGLADIIVGAGASGAPLVTIYDGSTGLVTANFFAFNPSFTGGVSVAFGRNGSHNMLIAGQLTGGGQVRTFDPGTLAIEGAFFAFDPTYTGGVSVAAGSFGSADSLFVGALGGSGTVNIFDAASLAGTQSFLSFAAGGVNVAGLFAPVPEPASWAFMLTGFAGVGIALRRSDYRRSRVAIRLRSTPGAA